MITTEHRITTPSAPEPALGVHVTDAASSTWVEEAGSMNMFFVVDSATGTTPTLGIGPVAARLRNELTGIQSGTVPDRFGWMQPVGWRS